MVNKRALFEVAATLLGIYFVVGGLGYIPFVLRYDRFSTYESVGNRILPWITPFIDVVLGFVLIAKARILAEFLISSDSPADQSPSKPLGLADCLNAGLRLLGAYTVIGKLPNVVYALVDVHRLGLAGIDVREPLATFLVFVVGLVLLFRAGWLTTVFYPQENGPCSERAESNPGSPSADAGRSADENTDGDRPR